jgi:uncharacterized membrane protein
MSAKNFFSKDQQTQIVAAIKEAELNTSGEIRVHVEENCKVDVMDRAAYVFSLLKMHKTKLRNGVLFYLALKDRKFAILGDAGINKLVEDNFWDAINTHVLGKFKEGNHADGLSEGIIIAGEQLKKSFPYQDDDINELDDEISFG